MSGSADSSGSAARSPALSVVVVTHDCRDAVARSLPALLAELRDGDELVVVDNGSGDGTADAVRELAPDATVFAWGDNLGFGAACNAGAVAAAGELLLFLNPDAVVQPGFRDAIERPLTEARGWAAWQGLVTAAGGATVNCDGGVVHFTGIAWAGNAGRPLEGERAAAEVPFASGACLAIRRDEWERRAGFAEHYFLYQEDVDLSLRVRLAGGVVGLEPAARADHDYEFAKGPHKWRYLERNRWATVLRTYPPSLLALLAPALALTELALVPVAATGGWLPEKLRAWGETTRRLPALVRERRAIQSERRIGAAEFARQLTADLDSEYLGRAGRSRALRTLLRGYWSLVRGVLALGGGPSG